MSRIEKPTKWVVVRSSASGVWLGRLEEYHYECRTAVLVEARRAYQWTGAATCSQLAIDGPTGGKMPGWVDRAVIADVCEVLDATSRAVEAWHAVEVWSAR